MAKNLVAVVVVGDTNMTRVTVPEALSQRALDSFARQVAGKEAGRTYYVVPISDTRRGWKQTPGRDPLYVWHVGDGFEHAEGWWVNYE